MSKRPVTGVDQAWTTPGSRWPAGHARLTAYTLGNRRRAAGSLAIPFWRHTIGVSGGATVARVRSAAGVCWLLTAMSTTWLLPHGISRGWPTAARRTVSEPAGDSRRSPHACRAARCAPRAISVTSQPAWERRPPTTAPIAPAPRRGAAPRAGGAPPPPPPPPPPAPSTTYRTGAASFGWPRPPAEPARRP